MNDDEPFEGGPETDAPEGMSRRAMLELCGASIALAGAAGCGQNKRDKLLPYTVNPRDLTPGFLSAMPPAWSWMVSRQGCSCASMTGALLKIEGNPDHPASLGASGVF